MMTDKSRRPSAAARLNGFWPGRALHLVLAVLAITRPCRAQEEPVEAPAALGARPALAAAGLGALGQAEADAYCRHVVHRASSVSARLYSPTLFSTFGVLRGSPVDPEGLANPAPDLVLNFRAGIEVSPTRMYAGALLEEQARADCGRQRAELALQELPREHYDEGPALAAQAEVLRGAALAAREILAASQDKLSASRTTLQAYTATRLRVEAQQRLLAEVDARLARLPQRANAPAAPKQVFEAVRFWEGRRQAVEGSLRRLESVEVALRGGYNELLSVPQDLPIFASVNVGFSPGWFWQKAAERESASARRDWVEARLERVRASLRATGERLGRESSVAQRRLEELSASLADLELRYDELKGVRTSTAEELMEYLWFDLVRLRAERAYAHGQVQMLQAQRLGIEESLR